MTIPDKPLHHQIKPGNTDLPELNNSIEELDNLINDPDSPAMEDLESGDIPVLDELIEPENFQEDSTFSTSQINNLIDNVEEKISSELDDLVNLLKDTIRDSIVTELKSQLEKESGSSRQPHTGIDKEI